jgi:DNA-binding transcriptional ArsR family regulator
MQKAGRTTRTARREEAVYRALADPTRRRILALLAKEEMTVGALAAAFPRISRPAVSKHLALLLEAGLTRVHAEGRERIHRLDTGPLAEVVSYVASLDAFWAQRLGGLGAHLDRMAEDEK